MTISKEELITLEADPRWPGTLLWRYGGGAMWSGGNAVMVSVAGLSHDPWLLGASLGTFFCGLVTFLPVEKNYEAIVGPRYVTASAIYTGRHLYNALTHTGSTPLAEWLSTGFGAGCTVGLAVWFFGKELKKTLDKVRPFERLCQKFCHLEQGALGRNIINSSYLLVASSSVTSLANGLATHNPTDIKRGAFGLTMLALWVGGDFPFAIYVKRQNQILQDALAKPAPTLAKPGYSTG